MRKIVTIFAIALFMLSIGQVNAQKKEKPNKNPKVNYCIDNMGYWQRMAKLGYVSVAPKVKVPKAIKKGTVLESRNIKEQDSPDIMITDEIEQTETSVFVDP